MIEEIKKNLKSKGYETKNKVYYLPEHGENYVSNFGKQWKDFSKTQVDKYNGTNISKNLLKGVIFNEFENLKNKTILEVGCGSGRFSQYLSEYAKLLIVNDMSEAIYYNHYKSKENVIPIKTDFLNINSLGIKFDIIICRGVLQHTPDPLFSIKALYDLCKNGGTIYFDIYRKPKFKMFNPKYIWRALLKSITYEKLYFFLQKNIDKFLKLRRALNKVFMKNLNFFWDYFFPIYDYKDKLPLNNSQLREWAILDTLDGLVTTYDIPKSYNEINEFLNKQKIYINNYNYFFSAYKIKKND